MKTKTKRKSFSTSEAASLLGQTKGDFEYLLRKGSVRPSYVTPSGHRRWTPEKLRIIQENLDLIDRLVPARAYSVTEFLQITDDEFAEMSKNSARVREIWKRLDKPNRIGTTTGPRRRTRIHGWTWEAYEYDEHIKSDDLKLWVFHCYGILPRTTVTMEVCTPVDATVRQAWMSPNQTWIFEVKCRVCDQYVRIDLDATEECDDTCRCRQVVPFWECPYCPRPKQQSVPYDGEGF